MPCDTGAMPEMDAMLDAHVRHELNRLTGHGISQTLTEEIAALFDWLKSIRLDDVITRACVGDLLRHYVFQATISDELANLVASALRSAHSAATSDATLLGDLLPHESYDQVARTVIGMDGLRKAATTQIATSEVYSRLLSHVIYQGIKNYLQSENTITRKVPGASTLMRIGQNAINTAVPKLEKTIDRQLTAFVNANIQDSIRESQRYLDKVLDQELMVEVADEVWDTNAKSTVADLVGLVPVECLYDFAEAGRAAWTHLRATPFFEDLAAKVVDDFLREHGARPIASVLADVGITQDGFAGFLADLITPVFDAAGADGYLEERIRARLEPFYSAYVGS